tara:strand:- start:597 stop:1148 length:552 start_codon:yes stop_codon:yes gene_type:complete
MKQCVLVGNAKFVVNHGELIDSYDDVYRFNRFRTIDFESKVGSKCTHWILNLKLVIDQRDYFRRNIDKLKKIHPNLNTTIVMTTSTNIEAIHKLDKIKSKYDGFDYNISKFRLDSKYKPSTGMVAIDYLLDKYEVLNLVGFDFGKTNHYWGVEGPSDIPGNHSWNLEIDYVNKLIENKRVKIW